MMDFSKYVNKLPYPEKLKFGMFEWGISTVAAARELIEKIEARIPQIAEHEKKVAAYKDARAAYTEEELRIRAQFKLDLFAELGISDHPKREALFAKAWDHGHSAGFQEVFACACDLVDLI